MRRLLAYARSFDQLVIQHPEEPSLAGAGEVNEGEIATRLGLARDPADWPRSSWSSATCASSN